MNPMPAEPTSVEPIGLAIFAVAYLLISARRLAVLGLDRPAVAMAAAFVAVLVGAISPEAANAAVEPNTILLLLGLMGLGSFLSSTGLFDYLELRAGSIAKTPQGLLGALIWTSGLLSALVTNDAVCVLAAPLVVRLIQRHQLPPLPYLLALATSANTGSVATLLGNPQNMLCGVLGNLSYREHLLLAGPIAILGLILNHAWIAFLFRNEIAKANLNQFAAPLPFPIKAGPAIAVILGLAVACTLGAPLAWSSIGAFALLLVIHRGETRTVWPRIDFSLLIFFGCLFILVETLRISNAPALLFQHYPITSLSDPAEQAALFLVGSNLVSNVPFILVVAPELKAMPNPKLAWELLAISSTFAGNLSLLGSVANIIVAEAARDIGGIGFFPYLRVGFPLALVTTGLAVLWLSVFFQPIAG